MMKVVVLARLILIDDCVCQTKSLSDHPIILAVFIVFYPKILHWLLCNDSCKRR